MSPFVAFYNLQKCQISSKTVCLCYNNATRAINCYYFPSFCYPLCWDIITPFTIFWDRKRPQRSQKDLSHKATMEEICGAVRQDSFFLSWLWWNNLLSANIIHFVPVLIYLSMYSSFLLQCKSYVTCGKTHNQKHAVWPCVWPMPWSWECNTWLMIYWKDAVS